MIGQIHLKTKKYLYSPSSYIHKSLAEGGGGGGGGGAHWVVYLHKNNLK